MKTLFKIHPFTVISLFITLITGYFKETVIFMMIILIHEFGHILMAFILKWKIEKIVILPFGGVTIFNELLNKPLNEELLITLFGPLFQIVFTLIFNNEIIIFYSRIILLINLIPIYPLDGAKILNIFLNKIFSFKFSHILTIYSSYFICFFLFFLSLFKNNLIYLISISLLIFKLSDEIKNHEMLFSKFLYERYLYDLNFKKIRIVSSIKQFKRDYYHYIVSNKKIINEKECLKLLLK